MPIYVYKCDSCEHEFEQFQPMSDKPLVKCPECKKKKLYRVPQVPMLAKVGIKTLGALADQKMAKMSNDERKAIAEKYRTKRDPPKHLPKGAKVISPPSKREEPFYSKNQPLTTKQIQKLTDKQKEKYVKTGKI